MPMLTHPAFGPQASLIYITVGALIDVWTAVWYFGFARGETLSNTTWFWLVGLFLTGLVLMLIGVLLGPISQFARRAELPPEATVNAEAEIQARAASTPHPVVTTAAGAAGTAVPTAAAPAAAPAQAVPAAPVATGATTAATGRGY